MKRFAISCILTTLAALVPASAGAVALRDVRIAFEQRKDAVFVRQMVTVAPGEKDDKDASFSMSLPVGAREAAAGQDDGQPTVTLEGSRVIVPGPFPMEGRVVRLAYMLPILDGVVALDQELNMEIPVAHAAFVGGDDGIVLKGNGFSKAASRPTPEGVPAVFVVAAPLGDGHIQLLITGFSADYIRVFIILATVLSFSMLAVGIYFWSRRTIFSSSA